MLLEGQVKQTSDKGCQVYRLIFDLTTILTNHINRSFSTQLTFRCLFLNRHRQDCKWREHPITSHSYQRRLQKIRLKTKQTYLLKRNSEPTCPRFLGMNPASLTRRKDPLHGLITWLVTTWQRLHGKQSVWQKNFEVRSSVCFVGEWKRLTTFLAQWFQNVFILTNKYAFRSGRDPFLESLRTFRARRANCQTPIRLFWKVDLLTCFWCKKK